MQATKSKDEKLDAFVKCHRRTEGVMWELCNKVMGAIITDAAIFAHGGAYTGKMVTLPNPLNLDTTGYPPCTPPPDKEKKRGRKRRRRYPSRGEDYAEGSAPTRRRSACSHCGMSGHNMRTCPERMP